MSTCLSPWPADWLLALSNSKAIISQFIPLLGSEQDAWGTPGINSTLTHLTPSTTI